MKEPNCDMPWEVYLDWLEDQGYNDMRFIDFSFIQAEDSDIYHDKNHRRDLDYGIGNGGNIAEWPDEDDELTEDLEFLSERYRYLRCIEPYHVDIDYICESGIGWIFDEWTGTYTGNGDVEDYSYGIDEDIETIFFGHGGYSDS